MKMLFKKILALLVLTSCMQLSGFAAPKHDHLYKMDRSIFKKAPPISYHLVTTWESTYIDNDVYIEYKSFKVVYSAPLPYNVTISYNLYHEDTNGGDSNIEYFMPGSQGTTFTYLGYYETYYLNSSTNEYSSTDLILNYVQ